MGDIDGLCCQLESAGVTGVGGFRTKLVDNRGCGVVLESLVFEASTALMFRSAGCGVEMRDSPDLEVTLGAHRFFAEVKHFRRKAQDDIDDERLAEATDLLVPYGDTVPTEGSAAWDQIVAVACKKVAQYRPDAPNVLVINSSSANCIDDVIVPTAICNIDLLCRREPGHGLRKLNGILLVGKVVTFNRGCRSVHFFECSACGASLPNEVRAMLNGIESQFVRGSCTHLGIPERI